MNVSAHDPGDELEAYRQAVRSALARHERPCGGAELASWTESVREVLASLDAFGLLVAEGAGGSEAGLLPMVVVLEETGRAGVGRWFLSSAVVGAHLLAGSGSETLDRLLADVATGRRIAVPALSGPTGMIELAAVSVSAVDDGRGAVLTGEAAFVAGADLSDVFLVAANHASKNECGRVLVHAVERTEEGVSVGESSADAVNGFASLRFDGVKVPGSVTLPAALDEDHFAEVVSLGALAVSAEMVGSAQRVLELTVAYAGDRQQFGVPVGAFEMVQHHCAQMSTDVQGSRAITARAARALSAGDADRHRLASVAKIWSSRAYRRVTGLGHAVFGAIGFSGEHELPRHTATQVGLWPLWGDPAFHLARVARDL